MRQYHELLQNILDNGNDRGDRTGTGTRSIFGAQLRHNLQDGFPLLTTKKLSFKNIVVELLWFLRGDTNIKYLIENGCHIWDGDCYRVYRRKSIENGHTEDELLPIDMFIDQIRTRPTFAEQWGDLGPIYGKQWRNWEYEDARIEPIDQIKNVIESIRKNPEGRRHIVTAWNPAEVDQMALPPCHCLFQLYVHDGKLSCHMYQRSADVFLGVPYNIASYALLTHIIANQTGLAVGELVISFGDVHIYNNHRDQVMEQLVREPKPLPTLKIDTQYQHVSDLKEFHPSDFKLEGYDPHPVIRGELSVGV